MRTPIAVLAPVLLALTAPSYAASAGQARIDQLPSTTGMIVWTTREADGREHLSVAHADGSGQQVLTHPGAGEVDIDAQFWPDGEWIAYEHRTEESQSVRLVRPDGTEDHQLPVPCDDPCLGPGAPTWLSNQQLAISIAFGPIIDDTATEALLWTVRPDGTRLRRLSPAAGAGRYEDAYAHATRDGRHLVLVRFRVSDGASALYRSTRDGEDLQRITPWGLGIEVNDVSTATSGPTADLVLFEAYGRGDPEATFVDLGTVPALCASPRACRQSIVWLTDNKASGRRNANPHWSPSGRDYVFTERASIDIQDVQIWTASFGSGERREISTSPLFDYRPDWGR